MAKQKLTRKSYKRNIIVFGLMFFMGISLVAVGFATWILSRDTSIKAENENVNVGIVSDNALEIKNKQFSYELLYVNDTNDGYEYKTETVADLDSSIFAFSFEPIGGDIDGDVKWDEKNFNSTSINYEVLSLRISGNITPLDFIQSFSVTMKVPEGIITLAEEGYIVLPAYVKYTKAGSDITFAPYEMLDADLEFNDGCQVKDAEDNVIFDLKENGDFVFTFEFGWGEKFNYTNPSIYFDSAVYTGAPAEWEPTITEDRDYQYIKTCLQYLRKQVHGCTYMVNAEDEDEELEVYTKADEVNPNCVLYKGQYYVATISGGKVTRTDTLSTWKPEQPTFDIIIDIAAN